MFESRAGIGNLPLDFAFFESFEIFHLDVVIVFTKFLDSLRRCAYNDIVINSRDLLVLFDAQHIFKFTEKLTDT